MDQDLAAILASIRQMPPWEENAYFDLPTVTFVPLSTGVTTQVIGASTMRVGLILSANGTALTIVGPTSKINNSGLGSVQGIPLTSGSPNLMITHEQFGPLVNQAWWAACNVASTVFTVVEVTLRTFPGRERRGGNRGRKSPPGPTLRSGWDGRQSPGAR